MSKVAIWAKLRLKEGSGADIGPVLAAAVAAADEEQGTEQYTFLRDDRDPNVVYVFEVYRDGEALAAHGKGPAMKAAFRALGAYLDGAPDITVLGPVAGKGL